MYKVFLVEDEIVVREGLKTIVPWQQYGFTFVGDASDGETALPRIRQTHPDLLITDIRMPFMDGLSLARIVRAEFPSLRIVIASGYDDFEYAQQAIQIGVDEYLLKPITKAALLKTLSELKSKMDAELEQAGYYERFRREVQEYEQFSRRRFFERLVDGRLSVQEIYEQAAALELDVTAQQYNVLQFIMQEKDCSDCYSESLAHLQDELLQSVGCCPAYLLFRWNLNTWAVLIKGTEQTMAEDTKKCAEIIVRRCETADSGVQWYFAAGQAVGRLSALPGSFSAASRRLAHRFLYPQVHDFSGYALAAEPGEEENRLQSLNPAAVDPSRIVGFLKTALPEDVENFVAEYLSSIGEEALKSVLFCQYVLLNVRFTAASCVEAAGGDKDELFKSIEPLDPVVQVHSPEQVSRIVTALLRQAIVLRERSAAGRYHDLLGETKKYIEAHYTSEDLSLNEVARAVNLSASYFSALFSQEMGKTFTEYVTERRMDKACELLRTTNLRSSEIAFAIGYKDAHYFSFLFKKSRGCTPRDYRARAVGGAR